MCSDCLLNPSRFVETFEERKNNKYARKVEFVNGDLSDRAFVELTNLKMLLGVLLTVRKYHPCRLV